MQLFLANQFFNPYASKSPHYNKYHQQMSKQNDPFDDDFGEEDQINNDLTSTSSQNIHNHFNFAKDFQSNPTAFDDMGSFGPGIGRMGGTIGGPMGGMHGLGGFGMGGDFGGFGSFGGGHSRFGGSMFGDYGGFGHPHGGDFSADGLFNIDPKQKKQEQQKQKTEDKEQPQQPEESEQEKLARLTKKKEIPEDQQITLVDWAIRGPAEIIRMVLQYILIPYKEKKYVFITKDIWFKEDRPQLQQTHPGIQLPYLQDGSNIIYGTQAILTYILHKYSRTELLGKTPDEKVRIATASSIFWQFMQDYYELVYGEYDESLNWEKAQQRYINQKFRVNFFRMVTYLKQTNHMSASSEFSWVDLAIADMVSVLNQMDKRFKQHNNSVQNYANRVFALPQLIVYRRSERFHERPYNGLGSIWK